MPLKDDVLLTALTRALLGIREAVDGALYLVGALKGVNPAPVETPEGKSILEKIQANTFGAQDQQ